MRTGWGGQWISTIRKGKPIAPFRRRYRVCVDVDVRLRPIDVIDAAENWRFLMQLKHPFNALGVTQHKYIACQQRLLDGLLRDEATLDAWLRNDVSLAVTDGDADAFQGDAVTHEMLAPIIPELPEPDREYFEAMLANDRFHEAAESLFAATRSRVVSMTIEEILNHEREGARLHVDQRYRASIDVIAEIGEIDPGKAAQDLTRIQKSARIELGVSMPEYADRQRELRDTLIRNKAVLDVWLRDQILADIADGGARQMRVDRKHADILRPVIDRMPAEDLAYLERAVAGDFLYEAVESFQNALDSDIVSVAVIALPEALADA